MTSQADQKRISQSLNLAANLSDGMKVYIPRQDDPASLLSVSSTLSSEPHIVSLSTASEAELDSLPGIGAQTVAKIVAAWPFSSIDELVTKKIVSQTIFAKIKALISP